MATTTVSAFKLHFRGLFSPAGAQLLCTLCWLPVSAAIGAQDRPTIDPSAGFFLDSVSVTIRSPVPDAEIRYSTDRNQQPSLQSPRYTGPVTLKKTSRVSARLFRNGQPLGPAVETVLRITSSEIVHQVHPWNEQPRKAALMLTFAHADDDAAAFTGLIPYHAVVRKLPLIGICVCCADEPESSRWRRKELESAFWKYGMRNAPLFANMPDTDWSAHQAISYFYDKWDFKKLVAYLVLQIRTYRPEVVVTHDFYGEYLHTHHLITAFATHDAYFLAGDPKAFPEQLDRVRVWAPKKLYAHIGIRDQIEFDWSIRYPELGGKTPVQVAREAMVSSYLSQFVSQPRSESEPRAKTPPEPAVKRGSGRPVYGVRYGLLHSRVGPDVQKNDFFEHIDLSALGK